MTAPASNFTFTTNKINCNANAGACQSIQTMDNENLEEAFMSQNGSSDGNGHYFFQETMSDGSIKQVSVSKSQLDQIFDVGNTTATGDNRKNITINDTNQTLQINFSSLAQQVTQNGSSVKDTATGAFFGVDTSNTPNFPSGIGNNLSGDTKIKSTILTNYFKKGDEKITLSQKDQKGNPITLGKGDISNLPDSAFKTDGSGNIQIDVSSLPGDSFNVSQTTADVSSNSINGVDLKTLDGMKSDTDIFAKIETTGKDTDNIITLNQIDPTTGKPIQLTKSDFTALANAGKIKVTHGDGNGKGFALTMDLSSLPNDTSHPYMGYTAQWSNTTALHSSDGTQWAIPDSNSSTSQSNTSNSNKPSVKVEDGDSLSAIAARISNGDNAKYTSILTQLEQEVNPDGQNPNFIIHVNDNLSYSN